MLTIANGGGGQANDDNEEGVLKEEKNQKPLTVYLLLFTCEKVLVTL